MLIVPGFKGMRLTLIRTRSRGYRRPGGHLYVTTLYKDIKLPIVKFDMRHSCRL